MNEAVFKQFSIFAIFRVQKNRNMIGRRTDESALNDPEDLDESYSFKKKLKVDPV